jgi:hypothetical protein
MDGFLGLPTTWQAMVVLIAGAPYIAIVAGRLVPYRQVKDWKDLYFGSEATRERALVAMERGADAIEATNKVVQTALAPPAGESAHGDG